MPGNNHMKIAFIRAYNPRLPYQVSLPPLGIGYLTAMIKKSCPEVEVSFFANFDELIESKPDVVGISSATENMGDAIEMARMAKEICDAKTLIGGMHVTALPHALHKAFDVGCVGEGEITMVELVKLFQAVKNPTAADYEKVQGICFHRPRFVQVNPARPLIQDLDELPYPDRDSLGDYWKVPYSRQVHLISSRGCPYDCSFCSSSLHWKRFRYFSPEYTAKEIEYLRNRYNPKEIYFFDDLFIANRKRFRSICDTFRERGLHKDVVFRSYARVDLVDEELADLFEEMNFLNIDFGFESNAQPILDYFRKRNVTPEINQRAIDILSKRSVSIGANIIIGAPPETDATLDETIDFVVRNRDHINRFSLGPLFPLPGTPIWEEARTRGLVRDDMTEWEVIGFDPDNFDIANYPFMNDHMTREHFHRRYLDFRAIAKEINLIGQLRMAEWKERELQSQLETMRGSRAVQGAWSLRNGVQALRDRFRPQPVEIPSAPKTNATGEPAKRQRIGITPQDLEREKAELRSHSTGLAGFKRPAGPSTVAAVATSAKSAPPSMGGHETSLPHPG